MSRRNRANPFGEAFMGRKSLKATVTAMLDESSDTAFLRKEFSELGNYSRVGRVLRELVDEGKLVRVGYGLYAKARASAHLGRPVPAKPIRDVALEVLRKLGIQSVPTTLELEVARGKTTQVLTGRCIGITKGYRISRKIGLDGRFVTLKRQS